MTSYPTHIRIFDADPTDDLVKKRTLSIKELSAKFLSGQAGLDSLRRANDLAIAIEAKGRLSDVLSDSVAAAVSKQATAFVKEGQDLQILVCGMLAAITALQTSNPSTGALLTPDVLASGLWSALSFQPVRSEAKIEALRQELLEQAQRHVRVTAASARVRKAVPDFKVSLSDGGDAATQAEAMATGAKATITALRENAAVDREELDLLWWIQSDWSELLDRRFAGAPVEAAAIASGLECGRLLRRMPGAAHRTLSLRHVGDGETMTLPELLKKLGDDRTKLAAAYADNTTLAACPAVFPLITALGSDKPTNPNGKIKRSLSEWGSRALLESAVLHVTAHLPAVGV